MRAKTAVLAATFAAFTTMPAFAGSVSFAPTGPDTALGTSAIYSLGGTTITAYGYECSANNATTGGTLSGCVGTDLYAKNDGGAEVGLGLAGETDHEIGMDSTSADFLVGLDVSNLVKIGATSMTLTFGSWQPGETYAVLGYGSNPFLGFLGNPSFTLTLDGATNTKAFEGNDGKLPGNPQSFSSSFDLNSGDEFLVLLSPCAANRTAPLGPCGSNVTLESAATPEPGTLALFLTGLLGLGFGMRRRFAFQRQ